MMIPWKSDSAIVPAEAVEDMRKLNHNWNYVPLIRCRDCKKKDDFVLDGGQCGEDPDGFCAWAERRTDE